MGPCYLDESASLQMSYSFSFSDIRMKFQRLMSHWSKEHREEDKYTMYEPKNRKLLPSDISGDENFCRSDRLWPILSADPVCSVWDSKRQLVTLDMCVVDHCSAKSELLN